MNFGDVKTYVRNLINRTDLTDALAAQFIQQAQDRLERLVRPSFLQRYVEFTLDGTGGDWRVPLDFLELIALYTDHGLVRRVTVPEWLRLCNNIGAPQGFLQTGHDIRMRPYPDPSTTVYLDYYGVEPDLLGDADENYWSMACLDALVYGAAALAGDYFEDERLQSFEQKFQASLLEIQNQQITEDVSGSPSIAPAYLYPRN